MHNSTPARTRSTPWYPPALLRESPLIRVPLSAGTHQGFREWFLSTPLPPGVRASFLQDVVWIGSDEMDLNLMIPVTAFSLEGFRAWATSSDFPERGRISLIDGELWIEMSPESIESHIKVKGAITTALMILNRELRLGEYLSDGALFTLPTGVSTVPDALFISFDSTRAGRARMIPGRDERGDFTQIEGAPDWVLEIVSNSSVEKDTRRLRRHYLQAGVSEYWIIDARGDANAFQMLVRRDRRFIPARPKEGWYRSPFFGRAFRLERRRNEVDRLEYDLHVRAS